MATLGATALANAETYTVQKGDTLSAIAKKNGTTVDENRLKKWHSRC